MYEIKTQAFFSAAHHLLNYDGECENQHGHNWMVEAYVSGETLDKSNILIDYKVLKKELNAVLDMLDHKDLNELPEFENESPSSEGENRSAQQDFGLGNSNFLLQLF